MKQSEPFFSRYYENRNEVLYSPPPASVTLKAALLLLEAPCLPLHLQEYIHLGHRGTASEGEQGDWTTIENPQIPSRERKHTECQSHISDEENDCFLIPALYIENWIRWAFHQPLEEEKDRLQIALSIACEIYGFEKPEAKLSLKETGESDGCREHHPIVVKPQPRILKSYTSEAAPNTINMQMKQDRRPSEPGPIDATSLSTLGYPLLLRQGVILKNMKGNESDKENHTSLNASEFSLLDISTGTGIIPRMVKNDTALTFKGGTSLLNDVSNQHHKEGVHNEYSHNEGTEDIECVAVPARFYDLLANIHGVVCEDRKDIIFTSGKKKHGLENIIHHHVINKSSVERIGGSDQIRILSSLKSDKQTQKKSRKRNKKRRKKPIEFRRKVIPAGLAERSIKEQKGNVPEPSLSYSSALSSGGHTKNIIESKMVEVYPIKCFYAIADASDTLSNEVTEQHHKWKGFILLSSALDAKEAIASIIACVAPTYKRECKRCWDLQCHRNATKLGDRYELIDNFWPHYVRYGSGQDRSDNFSVGQWAKVQCEIHQLPSTLHLLIETRSSPSLPWGRDDLVLGNRIRNGDFVDALSVSGEYHEAMVTKVTDKTIKVHFLGLGKKADRIIPSNILVQNANQILPLWNQTRQWRDELKVGDEVEVREAASLIQRPRWYTATIVFIGKEDDSTHETSGGADLDLFDVEGNGVNQPILLLNRSQQVSESYCLACITRFETYSFLLKVLVEVEEERINSSSQSQSQGATKKLNVDPPFIRWVNLYGEEICARGTHIKPTQSDQKPATLIFSHSGSVPVEIMRPNNGSNGCGFVRESLKGVPAAPGSVGLHNLGNTCFLNSIIQCLNHIEPITKYFLSGTYRNNLNKSNPLGSGGRLAESYALVSLLVNYAFFYFAMLTNNCSTQKIFQLLEDIWSGEYSTIAPRNLKHVIGLFAAQFRNFQQHDSQEFCSFLMDGLHEDLNRVKVGTRICFTSLLSYE